MLSLQGVHKKYGSRAVVAELSLTLSVGEVHGLLGPSGAGKSCALQMAVGLSAPDRGTIMVRGLGSPEKSCARGRIGYAPQQLSLYDELTGRENVRLMAGLYGLTGRSAERQVDWALELLALSPRERDRVHGYSLGMKRRLVLAGAIVHKPLLLVLDEPTDGADPQARHTIFQAVRALRDVSTTVLYATQAMADAEVLCDRLTLLDEGRVVTSGSVRELLSPALGALVGPRATAAPSREPAWAPLSQRALRAR